MPASSSASSSTRPAGPTNGRPARSSWSPGCSPTNSTRASAEPSPKTVCVPVCQSGHALQSRASARSSSSAVTRCAYPPRLCAERELTGGHRPTVPGYQRTMKTSAALLVAAALTAVTATAASAHAAALPVSQIEQALNAKGTVDQHVLAVEIDRDDIGNRHINGVVVKPSFEI